MQLLAKTNVISHSRAMSSLIAQGKQGLFKYQRMATASFMERRMLSLL